MNEPTFEDFKKQYHDWCGFDMVAETKAEIIEELKGMQWTLECEINQQRKGFEAMINKIMPDDI